MLLLPMLAVAILLSPVRALVSNASDLSVSLRPTTLSLPPLSPGFPFIFNLTFPPTPTSPSVPALVPSPDLTTLLDLVATLPHRLSLTVDPICPPPPTPDPTPLSSPQLDLVSSPSAPPTPSPLPPCSPRVTDSAAVRTPSRRAFLSLTAPPATVLRVTVSTVGGYRTTALKLHLRRLTTSSSTVFCPGAAQTSTPCSGISSACTTDGICQCGRLRTGRACETVIQPIPTPARIPEWTGVVSAQPQSTILRVPAGGIVVRGGAAGGTARIAVRARVLRAALELGDGQLEQIDGGTLPLTLLCGMDDVPKRDDVSARATPVAQTAGEKGTTYELVCVTKDRVAEGGMMIMAFVLDGDIAAAPGGEDGGAVVSVTVRRCGGDELLDCPLGRGDEGGFPLGVALGLGFAVVVAVVALGILLFCGCRRASRAWRGSRTGSVVQGATWEVVEPGKGEKKDDASGRVSARMYAPAGSSVGSEADEKERERARRRAVERAAELERSRQMAWMRGKRDDDDDDDDDGDGDGDAVVVVMERSDES